MVGVARVYVEAEHSEVADAWYCRAVLGAEGDVASFSRLFSFGVQEAVV